jgi:hypothetical protein
MSSSVQLPDHPANPSHATFINAVASVLHLNHLLADISSPPFYVACLELDKMKEFIQIMTIEHSDAFTDDVVFLLMQRVLKFYKDGHESDCLDFTRTLLRYINREKYGKYLQFWYANHVYDDRILNFFKPFLPSAYSTIEHHDKNLNLIYQQLANNYKYGNRNLIQETTMKIVKFDVDSELNYWVTALASTSTSLLESVISALDHPDKHKLFNNTAIVQKQAFHEYLIHILLASSSSKEMCQSKYTDILSILTGIIPFCQNFKYRDILHLMFRFQLRTSALLYTNCYLRYLDEQNASKFMFYLWRLHLRFLIVIRKIKMFGVNSLGIMEYMIDTNEFNRSYKADCPTVKVTYKYNYQVGELTLYRNAKITDLKEIVGDEYSKPEVMSQKVYFDNILTNEDACIGNLASDHLFLEFGP